MITSAAAYVAARMKALGYKAWNNSNDPEEIADQRMNDGYIVELRTAEKGQVSQDNYRVLVPMTVMIFRGSSMKTADRELEAAADGERVVKDFILVENWATFGNGLKGVLFDRMKVEEFANNKNAFKVTLNFTALVIIATR